MLFDLTILTVFTLGLYVLVIQWRKTYRQNHIPGFSEFCFPGRLKGPDSCDNTMTGDDKQEAELEGATTDDAMSLSSPSPK